jgi:hypothetical protein
MKMNQEHSFSSPIDRRIVVPGLGVMTGDLGLFLVSGLPTSEWKRTLEDAGLLDVLIYAIGSIDCAMRSELAYKRADRAKALGFQGTLDQDITLGNILNARAITMLNAARVALVDSKKQLTEKKSLIQKLERLRRSKEWKTELNAEIVPLFRAYLLDSDTTPGEAQVTWNVFLRLSSANLSLQQSLNELDNSLQRLISLRTRPDRGMVHEQDQDNPEGIPLWVWKVVATRVIIILLWIIVWICRIILISYVIEKIFVGAIEKLEKIHGWCKTEKPGGGIP